MATVTQTFLQTSLLLIVFLAASDPSLAAPNATFPPSYSIHTRRVIDVVKQQSVTQLRRQQLDYDFYRDTCTKADNIVDDVMSGVVKADKHVPPQLLRLMFHDCFIQGCDASVLLDDSNGNKSREIERDALPNQTLKGFDVIDKVKDALEKECPNVVSCADIIPLATRDALVLSGGPFFPILTGRKDSLRSFYDDARIEIPKPTGTVSETLRLFKQRGFTETDIVSLLGAHSIGKIGCQFICPRLSNFSGIGKPDPTVSAGFIVELNRTCGSNATSVSSGSDFGTHYFKSLNQGRGLLHSDQNLMNDTGTASLVKLFSSNNASTFQWYFSKAMLKMSNLASPPGSQGEVRKNCSLPNSN